MPQRFLPVVPFLEVRFVVRLLCVCGSSVCYVHVAGTAVVPVRSVVVVAAVALTLSYRLRRLWRL